MRKSVRLKHLIMALALCLPVPAMAEDWVTVDIGETTVRWDVQGEFEQVVLTVSMPNGKVIRREVRAGEPVAFAVDDAAKDGVYKYEVRGIQRFDDSVRKELAAARKSGDEFDVIEKLKDAGRLPRDPAVRSGGFAVKDGVLVRPGDPEDIDPKLPKAAPPAREASGSDKGVQVITAADQVIPDDLIVQGSACVGLDCVNNENFGFDTIRLKENNLRIHFDDTSTQAGFPANDWRLIANDSASGGSSKFSIEDSTAARTPFTVEAGASTNSIFVDSTGRVGFRTSTPVLDLHVNTSNTPAIRLEQNNSGGFTAQTWDIGANEANFFVRDVTGGSRLSFRIRPGAPTSSVDISADGDVGIGTASPSTNLHVASSDGDATGHFLVTETNGTIATRTMAQFSNNGGVRVEWIDTSGGGTWGANLINGNFNILKAGTGVTAFSLQGNGTLTVVDLIESSDRDMKTDIVAVQAEEILSKVRRLPLSTWRFKDGDNKATHLGPMAQDFSALFGLGHDDKHIKALDVAGVSLAAVQALSQQVSAKDAEIAELKNQNGDLAKRLADLEALVSSLAGQPK